MINFNQPLPNGFGLRLRQERKRLKYSQTQLAELVGIGRIAQFQYEQESRSPNVKYLSAIASAGIDISFVLFNIRTKDSLLTEIEKNEIEKKALSLLFKNEREVGELDDEKRFVMFNLLRSQLIEAHIKNTDLISSVQSK